MRRKIVYALLAAVIAFGLWVYVITVDSPETEGTFYNIPVVLNGEAFLHERGMMLVMDKIPTVTLRLEGNRSHLNKLNSSNITLVADLSKISNTGEQELFYDVIYPGDIPSNAITELSKEPETIKLNVVARSQKNVDIQVSYTGQVPEGFTADKKGVILSQETVTVTGPKSVIDQIDHARIDVDLNGRSDIISESYTYTLCNKDGEPVDVALVETSVSEVDLTLNILCLRDVQLYVDVIYGGGADSQTAKVVVDPLTIQVSGSENMLNDLGQQLKLGTINLAEIEQDSVITFPIELPEGVNNVTGVTEASVSISFEALATVQLTINNFQSDNVAGGLVVEFLTKFLDVKLRGPKEVVENLTKNDVYIRVDFSGAEPGSGIYEAEIRLRSGFEDVGAVGTYSVYATVTQRN